MKKRVLLVSCGGLGNGGVQSIIMGIVRSLSDEFHFDILLFTSENRYYDDEFLSYGGKIFRIPVYEGKVKLRRLLDYYIRDFSTYIKLNNILKHEKPYDVIHCNREYENAPILMLASKFNIPVRISHAHIIHHRANIFRLYLDRIRQKIANHYSTNRIGCSIKACESLFSKTVDFKIINNFYDDGRFYLKNKNRDHVDNVLTIAQVGAISNTKNQKFTIEVVCELKSNGLPVKLRLIGFNMDNHYTSALMEEVAERSLSNDIEFYPGDANIPQLLESSDCFIMPSLSEGFGIALIEAQAMGLHCFASDNIPDTTNCGGVEYISLSKGVRYWAERIETWRETSKIDPIDTSKYKLSFAIEEYKRLYNRSGD